MRPLLILTLALFAGSACSAAIITFTGDDPNVADWRNPSVAKPLDTDRDNIYGTDGYVMFAAVRGAVTTSFGPSNAANLDPFTFSETGTDGVTPVRTLVQMPVYVTSFAPLKTGGPGNFTLVATSNTSPPPSGFTRIDDPLAAGQLMQSGLAINTSDASGSHNLFTFTVGGNVPSRFLVGLFFNNAGTTNGSTIGPPSTTAAGIIGLTGTPPLRRTLSGTLSPDALFFEIDGATGNDTFTVFADGSLPEIMGITFDTPVPEPATLGGCAAAVLVFLWLGRRSKNPKQWRPV